MKNKVEIEKLSNLLLEKLKNMIEKEIDFSMRSSELKNSYDAIIFLNKKKKTDLFFSMKIGSEDNGKKRYMINNSEMEISFNCTYSLINTPWVSIKCNDILENLPSINQKGNSFSFNAINFSMLNGMYKGQEEEIKKLLTEAVYNVENSIKFLEKYTDLYYSSNIEPDNMDMIIFLEEFFNRETILILAMVFPEDLMKMCLKKIIIDSSHTLNYEKETYEVLQKIQSDFEQHNKKQYDYRTKLITTENLKIWSDRIKDKNIIFKQSIDSANLYLSLNTDLEVKKQFKRNKI